MNLFPIQYFVAVMVKKIKGLGMRLMFWLSQNLQFFIDNNKNSKRNKFLE